VCCVRCDMCVFTYGVEIVYEYVYVYVYVLRAL